MIRALILLVSALAAGACVAAQTYKWVDERGVTTYGEKPPEGRAATPIDTTPSGSVDGGKARQDKAAGAARPEPVAVPAVSVPPPAPAARGMEFDTFIRLTRGMTEGELLQRAGKPDHESVENFRHDIVRTWYYFPTAGNPFTTVVTLRGGRIHNLDRVKKF